MGAVHVAGGAVSDAPAPTDEEDAAEDLDGGDLDGDGDDADGDDVDDDDVDESQLPGAVATDVLEYLVRALVDDGDAVEIDVDEDRRGLRMQVRVAPGEMGRVIGRRGRIANAIRTVVRAAATPDGVAVDVDFVD